MLALLTFPWLDCRHLSKNVRSVSRLSEEESLKAELESGGNFFAARRIDWEEGRNTGRVALLRDRLPPRIHEFALMICG